MSVRFFLSVLAAALFLSFASDVPVSAKPSQKYSSTKKTKKKYVKRVGKSRNVRNTSKNAWRKNARYKRKSDKKVTKASLNVGGIKNLRHAKLTSGGRMSTAKDTRRNTLRDWGKRVSYKYKPGTIVVSNYTRRLYYVVRRGKVISYPIATPRPNEVWSGKTVVSEKKVNPDWYPTPSMREKDPRLPEKVPGGHPSNPFGKRALYLGKSFYRIHGTNSPKSIGRAASGGCYRMRNKDINSLFRKVRVGTPVIVTTRKNI